MFSLGGGGSHSLRRRASKRCLYRMTLQVNGTPSPYSKQVTQQTTPLRGKPSTTAWVVAHLLYPLLPALLEAGIRLVTPLVTES